MKISLNIDIWQLHFSQKLKKNLALLFAANKFIKLLSLKSGKQVECPMLAKTLALEMVWHWVSDKPFPDIIETLSS